MGIVQGEIFCGLSGGGAGDHMNGTCLGEVVRSRFLMAYNTFNMPTINRKITHDYWWTILAFSTSGQLIAIWWAANGPEKKRKIHCIICFR